MHGIPMFIMYTGTELAKSLSTFGIIEKAEVLKTAEKYAEILEKDFFNIACNKPYNAEMIGPSSMADTLLFRHLTPGHTLECLWFYIHHKDYLNTEKANSSVYISRSDSLGRYALEKGWDEKYGGIFRYVDCEGGEPHGRLTGNVLEKSIISTWETKLW